MLIDQFPPDSQSARASQFSDVLVGLRADDRAIVLVTHYQRLLDYIVPDRVHVLASGRIIKSGDKDLALELERRGYDWVRQEASAA